MKRKSKREMVLDIYDREAMGEVTAREIAMINAALVAEFGEGGALDPGEIARILHAEDLPIRFEQVFRMAKPTEKYETLFAGIAYELNTLARAEQALRNIDGFYREFKRAGDRTGVRFARQAALDAKQKAVALAQAQASQVGEQHVQGEIAQWFTVWLQTPEIWAQWIELRKATAEFKTIFGAFALGEESGSVAESQVKQE